MMKRKVQQGFSLISAIFLIVVMALLAAMMVPFYAAEQKSSGLDVQGAQAYHAAKAGIEWAAYQIAPNPPSPAFAMACQNGTTPPQPGNFPGITGISIVVTCSAINSSEVTTSTPLWVYTIMSTASLGSVTQIVGASIADGGGNPAASGVIYQTATY